MLIDGRVLLRQAIVMSACAGIAMLLILLVALASTANSTAAGTLGTPTTLSIPHPHTDGTVAAVGNKVLFAGGASNNYQSISDVVDIYDASTGQWTTASLSQPRHALASVTLGTKVFFAGGQYDSAGHDSTRVDIYDSQANSWSTTELSEPRHYPSPVAVNGKVIIAGGWNSSGERSTYDIYDVGAGTWTSGNLPTPTSGDYQGSSVGNLALIADHGEVNIYDSQSDTWLTPHPLSVPRTTIAATTLGTKVIFAGGQSPSGNDAVDIFNAQTSQWQTATLSQARFTSPVTFNNRAYFIGGWTGSTAVSTIDVYDGNSWTVEDLPSPSWGDGPVVADGKLFVEQFGVSALVYSAPPPVVCDSQSILSESGASTLYCVDPNSPASAAAIGPIQTDTDAPQINDIAVSKNGLLYGISGSSLYEIDKSSAHATQVGDLGVSDAVALTFGPDGHLYAATDSGDLLLVDPSTGNSQLIGSFGGGFGASGDIAFDSNGRLHGTGHVASEANTLLLEIDPATGQAQRVGNSDLGSNSVFGLVWSNQGFLGLTNTHPDCNQGALIKINENDGSAALAGCMNFGAFGATLAPVPVTQTATFTVQKNFSDNNSASVSVSLTCSSGSIVDSLKNASHATPAVFTVNNVPQGGTSCTATEAHGPDGYSVSSDCANVHLTTSASCTLTNTLITSNSAILTVDIIFSDNNTQSVLITPSCQAGSTDPASQNASRTSPAVFTVTGIPAGGTHCSATPFGSPGGYTETNACENLLVTSGANVSCAITYTVSPVILYITGIASSGDCNTPVENAPANSSQPAWNWITQPLEQAGQTSNDDFVEYIYKAGDGLPPDCSTAPNSTFDSGDSCWSLDHSIDPSSTGSDPPSGSSTTLSGEADKLAAFLHTFIGAHPGVQLSIIGHSQGGLLAAYVIKQYSNDPEISKIKSVITLDSPLKGINSLAGNPLLNVKDIVHCGQYDKRYDSVWDMLPGSSIVQEVMSSGKPTPKLFTVDEEGLNNGIPFIDNDHSSVSWETDHFRVLTGNHDTLGNGTGEPAATQLLVKYIECALAGTSNNACSASVYKSILGDANGDGKVDASDVSCALGAAAGLPPATPCPGRADVNCDGKVDGQDALLLLKYMAHVISSFPCAG